MIALDGDTWIGMAAASKHSGFVFNEMAGVRAGYCGRGISVVMKAFGLSFAELCGVTKVRTFHHPADANVIATNRTMGYVDAEWEL